MILVAWNRFLSAIVLCGTISVSARGQSDSVEQRLGAIERLYAFGAFEEAAQEANRLLERDEDLDRSTRSRLYLMKARIEVAFGRSGDIGLWLAKAKRLQPDLAPDPVKDPPPMIEGWEALQTRAQGLSSEGGGRARFLIRLLPFGIGHFDAGRQRDGGFFWATESLLLMSAAMLGGQPIQDSARRARVLASLGFLGIYGYELYDRSDAITSQYASWSLGFRDGLRLLPFGVGQAVNNETLKAAGFLSVQSLLLVVATTLESPSGRRVALSGFGAVWAYSVLDAWLHRHRPMASGLSLNTWNLGAIPIVHAEHLGVGLVLTWQPSSQ